MPNYFLLRPAVLLLAICALLCLIIPVFGARPLESNPAWQSFGFDVCELPCFSGITPGKTPFQNAASLLRRNVALIGNRLFNTGTSINFWAAGETQELAGVARNAQGTIGDMSMSVRLPVDQVIAQLGMPDCMMTIPSENPLRSRAAIFWFQESTSIQAILDQPTLNLRASVRVLLVAAFERDTTCAQNHAFPWVGFAPAWKYTH